MELSAGAAAVDGDDRGEGEEQAEVQPKMAEEEPEPQPEPEDAPEPEDEPEDELGAEVRSKKLSTKWAFPPPSASHFLDQSDTPSIFPIGPNVSILIQQVQHTTGTLDTPPSAPTQAIASTSLCASGPIEQQGAIPSPQPVQFI